MTPKLKTPSGAFDNIHTRDMIEVILQKHAPKTQALIRELLWTLYGRAVTQQAISYHLRQLGAIRADHKEGGYWFLPGDPAHETK